MIAHHEIAVGRHDDLRIGAFIAVDRGDVIFAQRLPIDINLAGVDADTIASDADNAFDKALRRIRRIVEHHDVAALNRLQAIDKLVDEDPLLILERRHHACAFDLDRLIQEDDGESRNRKRDHQIAQPHRQQPRPSQPFRIGSARDGLGIEQLGRRCHFSSILNTNFIHFCFGWRRRPLPFPRRQRSGRIAPPSERLFPSNSVTRF